MAEHPKVFISYSHDSSEHRRWVSELGAKLRDNGVDAILDQWDLGPGADVTQFMERGIIDSDRVLVICTDQYVRKANTAEGGVGYERMIVTAQLVQDLGTDKFIPVIRQASGQEKTPTFLGTRVYIDFRNDSQFDKEFAKLIRELHRVRVVEKPPLGKNPFARLPSGQEVPSSEGLDTQSPEISEQVESVSDAYAAAVKYARAGDVLGWRHLVKGIKSSAFNSLVQRRQKGMAGEPPKGKGRLQAVEEAVKIISPLICVALVGVESGREQFRDQKSTLDDLLNIVGERDAGSSVWVDIPRALGYVYHSLHGGLSLSTNQLDLALNLARVKVLNLYKTEHRPVWETDDLIGWFGSFGPDCTDGWKYLIETYQRKWEWLVPIFGDESEYRTSLVAYYMALNIHELAAIIASGEQDTLESRYRFTVPLTFFYEDYNITQRATSRLRNQEKLTQLWACLNVTREQMEDSWEDWIRSLGNWFGGRYEGQHNSIGRRNLTDIFRYFLRGYSFSSWLVPLNNPAHSLKYETHCCRSCCRGKLV